MLKLIAGTLGALFVYAAYKLVTADGTQTVAPPDKATTPKPTGGGGGGGKPGVVGHHG